MAVHIPIFEAFAESVCKAHHPFVGQTGSPVPCGRHRQEATRIYALLEPDNRTLPLIVAQRGEKLVRLDAEPELTPVGVATLAFMAAFDRMIGSGKWTWTDGSGFPCAACGGQFVHTDGCPVGDAQRAYEAYVALVPVAVPT